MCGAWKKRVESYELPRFISISSDSERWNHFAAIYLTAWQLALVGIFVLGSQCIYMQVCVSV